MTRVRIDINGIAIAQEGYDVDTAPLGNINFSPSFVAMRLALKGLVTVANYSGAFSGDFKRAIVTFPTPFPKPPIVLVAGQRTSDGGVDQTAVVGSDAGSGTAFFYPIYQIITTTTGFELYVNKGTWANTGVTRPADWRYWVFRNTVED